MANCKSAKKRIITNEKRRIRNNAYKSKLKTLIKKVSSEIESKAKTAEETLRVTTKYIDKLAAKGILHKNTAARKKSSLVLAFNAIK